MRRLLASTAVAVCLAGVPFQSKGCDGPADRQTAFDQAASAMQRGDYAVAYCLWRPLADKGDAQAQYSLGWMYHNGYGLAIDDQAAVNWWRKAVAQGDVDAMFSLGTLYNLGSETVPRDLVASLDLWAKAAEKGNPDARMALRQLAGRGIPEVDKAAGALLADNPGVFGDPEQVKAARANVRKGPGTNQRIVTVLQKGQPVVELLRRNDWVRIGVVGSHHIGWIFGKLIEKPAPAETGEAKKLPDSESTQAASDSTAKHE